MVKDQGTKSVTKTGEGINNNPASHDLEHKVHDSASQGSALDHNQAISEDEASQSTNVKASALTKHHPAISHKHSPRVQTSQRKRNTSPSSSTKHQSQTHPQTQSSRPRQQPTSSSSTPSNMSKLSSSLKQLINAPFSKPSTTVPNLQSLQPTINKLVKSAQSHNVSVPAWLTFTTATAMTMNSPTTLTALYQTATSLPPNTTNLTPLTTAELQREVGLKCISFNGIPRAINCLGAYHASLPDNIKSQLSSQPTREVDPKDSPEITQRKSDGLSLWDSVYAGFERKLLNKLSQSHPDLPVHIINSHYANLLSNPSRTSYINGTEKARETHVGRVLTSLVAIACLRAQTGVAPQVTSHIFGLRKAYENGDADAEGEVEVGGGKWLSGEEGNKWLLGWIDELVRAIGTRQEGDIDVADGKGQGPTTFAPGIGAGEVKAKL